MIARIKGPTILLGSGAYFDFTDPEGSAARVTIEDVAWGLAGCARFAGQTIGHGGRRHYSVAEHCFRMAVAVPPALALAALLHDCGEAVCGDMTAPLKALCADFAEIEQRCGAALQSRFGAPAADPALLKHWDLRMLATERRDLMNWQGEAWACLDGIEPLAGRIVPVGGERAAARFLHCYRTLAG